MRFDAHQHFWNIERLDYPILRPDVFGELYRTIEPPELEPLLCRHGIDGTVVVQAMDACEETEYLLELADRYEWIAGIVGWVDLANPRIAAQQLRRFSRHPKFKGVRHLIMVEPDPDWLIRSDVAEGLKVLASFEKTFDVGAEFPKHLHHVAAIAERVPALRIVIDHLAKPPIGEQEMNAWEREMRRAADYPQVYAKVSGFDPAGDIGPVIDTAFRLFGADRLLFGSDWPVANFTGSYDQVWHAVNTAVSGRTPAERKALFGGTAKAFYRL